MKRAESNRRVLSYSYYVVFALVVGSAFGRAQAQGNSGAALPSNAPTLSVDARLVNLPVVVRDKKGALVRNLTKDEFVLQVDGRPQTIRYFDVDKDLPLTLGLLVDTSLSQRSVLDEERSASGTFLQEMLNANKDKAFIVQFARQVELLVDVTNSHGKLQAALKEIGSASTGGSADSSNDDSNDGGGGRQGRRGGWRSGIGTTLYDATFLASDELMSKQKGRKALIILSDGVDRGSKETQAKAIEAAQRADTILYAIYFKGNEPSMNADDRSRGGGRFPGGRFPGGGGYPGGGGGRGGGNGGGRGEEHVDGKKVLERMAEETGGRLFEVTKKQTVAKIYDLIAEELRSQYRLGYTPDEQAAADGYHKIDLTANRKDLYLQTREGYYTR